MTALQIISYEPCGKTALCAGIGKKLINGGKKVGYVKPINITGEVSKTECFDAQFMKGVLELGEEKDQLYTFHLSREELWRNLSEDADNFAARLKSSCDRVAAGKDILIVESPGALKADQISTLACYTIAEKLDARVVLLLCYSSGFGDPEILHVVKKLGDRLIGVVLNQVPQRKIDMVKAEVEEFFKPHGVRILGVLPESRTLLSVSVADIASAIGGEIISSKERAGELVENVMLGAMTPDSAKDYYARKQNKAVVLRSERPDMQLAALETSIKCLIVTNRKPSAPVMVKAEDKNVPVMVVNKDISEIIAGIEQTLSEAKFQHIQKLSAFGAIMESRFDFKALTAALA